MKDSRLHVGIIGSGNAAFELIKILEDHPMAALTAQHSKRHGTIIPPEDMARQCDVVFDCGKDEENTRLYSSALLNAGKKFIDLGGSYRWKDPAVYGLTELFAEKIRGAKLVANPGCYPTAFLLGIAPLLKHDMADTGQLVSVAAISGYSGKGQDYKPTGGVHPYGVDKHKHVPEMIQACMAITAAQVKIAFTPHVNDDRKRGLETVTTFVPKKEVTQKEIDEMLTDMYYGELFVQHINAIPNMNVVVNTHLCQIAAWVHDGVVKVMAALDNLRKGAATQAVQNMNLMFELPKNMGLLPL